jgi:dihydrofolate synthase/folylpolyglutamate synthase
VAPRPAADPLPEAIRTRGDLDALLAAATNYEERAPVDPASRAFDLRRMEALLASVGSPHVPGADGLPRVAHVAGSKGKGSTCRMLDAILRAAARGPVGLYTSPHLEDLTERIAVDGVPADDDALCRSADRLLPHVRAAHGSDLAPTFFEILTAAAWLVFRARRCADVVLEVGLGGRLDATNVCAPAATVVTTIEREHVRILGDTVEAIAAEKAGILKRGVPAVTTATDSALAVVEARAHAVGAPLAVVGRDVVVEDAATGPGPVTRARIRVGGAPPLAVEMPVAGLHHATNAAAAVAVALGFGVSRDDVVRGLASLRLPGTLEVVAQAPTTVVDGAHTPTSARTTRAAVEACWPGRPVHVVLAAMEDKDVEGIARALGRLAKRLFVTSVESPRAVPADLLARRVAAVGGTAPEPVPGPLTALRLARAAAGEHGLVLVTGSVYLAGLVRAAFAAP